MKLVKKNCYLITSLLITAFSVCSCSSTNLSKAPIPHTIRLLPGDDLYISINKYVKDNNIQAGSIVSSVGSLTKTAIRYANQEKTSSLEGHFEIVSLSGVVSTEHLHIHIAVSDGTGKTIGGHLMPGNIIYTTEELVILEYPNLKFSEKLCNHSGYNELYVEKQ